MCGGGAGGHSAWRRRTQCVDEEEDTVCGRGGGGHSVWRRRTQCVEEELGGEGYCIHMLVDSHSSQMIQILFN